MTAPPKVTRTDVLRGIAGALLCPIWPAMAASDQQAGPMKLIIPTAKGGINDLSGRLVANHLGRFLPGTPVLQAVNDESGGVAVANRFATEAARTQEIAILQRGIAQLAIQGDPRAKFDPLKLNWLGSLSSFANDAYVLIVNARHPAKTVQDLAPPAPPALIGGDAPGSTNLTFALIAKHALGLNIDIKDGFSGAAGMFFAMKDGDLDGQVIGLNSLMANQAAVWRNRDVRPLLQFGRRTRHPLLPEVPLASEYTHDRDALSLVAFAEAPLGMALPFVAPIALPRGRVTDLQRAFSTMTSDPGFLADAAQAKLDITPVDAAGVRRIITAMKATPKELVARYNTITTT